MISLSISGVSYTPYVCKLFFPFCMILFKKNHFLLDILNYIWTMYVRYSKEKLRYYRKAWYLYVNSAKY